MSNRTFRGVVRLASWIRDAWLMIGVTLLMLLALELAYRAQSAARHALASGNAEGAIGHPYADSAWYPAYLREYDSTFALHWKPYVYFRRPAFAGAFINVDSAGHRRTVPASPAAADTVRVFFFGGSTMWGSYLRDASTIPSVVSRRLLASAPAGVTFDVTNFGESGYVFTQELLELELQLRAGHVPDVVVFYDGINDLASAAQFGEVGVPQNESNRVREFEFGRAIYGSETGVGSDLRAAGAIGTAIIQRFQAFQRLVQAVARPATPAHSPADLSRRYTAMYAANARIVEALSRAYGFRVLYVWQPSLQATGKRLTPWESQLLASIDRDPFQQRLRALHAAVLPLLPAAVGPAVGARFVNESTLFANDTTSVFTDQIGHNTEKAIPGIVSGFYPQLAALLDSVRVSPGMRSR